MKKSKLMYVLAVTGSTLGMVGLTSTAFASSVTTSAQSLQSGYTLAGSNLYNFEDAPETISYSTSTITITKPQTETRTYAAQGSDILFDKQEAPYTIPLPNWLGNWDIQSVTLKLGGTLDDHYNQSANLYTGQLVVNNQSVFSGQWKFQHGSPYGGQFTNYSTMSFNLTNLIQHHNTVNLFNTSNSYWLPSYPGYPNWISVDNLQLVITLRHPIPQELVNILNSQKGNMSVSTGTPHNIQLP
ncbi:hypothetical protein LLE49_24805 [Alicyclobacillus tolerans]|uniref:hypothetical protein n=1 Tax=Alicyclobacillus tolerans TaxID=90970 RepID=UPI001F40B160|nr:hypothetical protein [Alicyclobacillus tolerans]MCF8567948.1 hypothetical protein [Alicyclobacillus tolerans]